MHFHLLETHQGVPIYRFEYLSPTVFSRSIHQEELEAMARIPDPRFALVIDCHHLSIAGDYRPQEQVELEQSAPMQTVRERAVAVTRYNLGSLTSLIRTMAVHAYARRGTAAGFASDLDLALRHVRREIEEAQKRTEPGAPPPPALPKEEPPEPPSLQ